MFSVWCLSSTLNTLSFFFPCLGWRNLKAQVFNSRNLGTCAPDVSDQDQKCAKSISSSLSNYYSRGNITWVKCLGAHISYNKACKPINLGAK